MQSSTENFHASELSKFGKQAQAWWDPEGPLWTLHAINPLRCQFIDAHVNVAELEVLDVGCGGGLLTEALAYRGAKVTGIDMSTDVIAAAKAHAQADELDIKYQITSMEQLASQHPNRWDVITCMEMLEHVPNPAEIITAIASALKPGGWAFFSTINRTPKAFVQAIVGAEHILKLIPKGTHHYEMLIQPAELANWSRAVGLEVCSSRGIRYNPLFKRFSLTSSLSVNYLLAARKHNV